MWAAGEGGGGGHGLHRVLEEDEEGEAPPSRLRFVALASEAEHQIQMLLAAAAACGICVTQATMWRFTELCGALQQLQWGFASFGVVRTTGLARLGLRHRCALGVADAVCDYDFTCSAVCAAKHATRTTRLQFTTAIFRCKQ